ncbi:MAG TPA: TCP-1/cpn60 chaperonin family protein, partial [Ktedonobacteraceae bacterium]|nr:TCP-1/cpn60 chaperonin family protein [Ktedonobacteraceae bacterium]
MPATNTRHIITGEDAQKATAKAVELTRELARAAYGPQSGNVGLEATYGDPISSHDGVFNLDHLQLQENAELYPLGTNMAARTLIQASKQTNVHAGDGTTAAAILACALYDEAKAQVVNGVDSRMGMARRLTRAAAQAVTEIEKMKVEATPELLQSVAVISASDADMGMLISDTIQEVGADGGVIIENFSGSGIYNDIVSGFYFRRGFTEAALLTDPSNLESRFDNVAVLVCDKPLSNVGDIAPILNKLVGANIHELLLVGNVTGEALIQAVKSRLDGHIVTTIVDAPDFGPMRTLFMEDLAAYTGAKVLSAGANPNDFTVDMVGEAKVVVNEYSTTLINGDGDTAERIKELTEELRVSTSPIEQEAVRTRLGRLTGKIAILRVGGNTPAEQQEVKFRVEDAVAALQAAIKEGVVPGGGVVLARLPKDMPFKRAFEQPLLTLLANAGRNSDRGLWHVQEAKPWHGYDLRKDEERLVELTKAGVVDPTLVVKEVVNN